MFRYAHILANNLIHFYSYLTIHTGDKHYETFQSPPLPGVTMGNFDNYCITLLMRYEYSLRIWSSENYYMSRVMTKPFFFFLHMRKQRHRSAAQ